MEQYNKSGPKVELKAKEARESLELVNELKQQIERQDRRIEELERDLRRLRNDMRMAIATANTINANRQRNG